MKITNRHNLPQTYVDLVHKLVWDPRDADPKRIGVTTLIQNPRIKLLSLAHWDEIEVDVADYLWLLLGNSVHYVLSKIDADKEKSRNRLIEEKIVKEIDGLTIVGKLDLYESVDQSIEDYKITSVWSVRFGDHDDWESQLNPYAWFLQDAGFPVKKGRVNAILRDWRKSESFKYDDYPKIPFVSIPVKIWTPDQQLEFIKNRVEMYKEAMAMPLADLPICSSKERWAKHDAYAIYKGSNKTASRVLNSEVEAQKWIIANQEGKTKYNVVKRCGEDTKCLNYCNVNKFCSYWQEKYGGKDARQESESTT